MSTKRIKPLIDGFLKLHRSVQLLLATCLLIAVVGVFALLILVAINPLSLGSIITLITTVTGIITIVLGKNPTPPSVK
jgi:hypothetical protein